MIRGEGEGMPNQMDCEITFSTSPARYLWGASISADGRSVWASDWYGGIIYSPNGGGPYDWVWFPKTYDIRYAKGGYGEVRISGNGCKAVAGTEDNAASNTNNGYVITTSFC